VQDLSLAHALGAARDVARRHDGETWRRLERRVHALLERLHEAGPDQHSGHALRLSRTELDDDRADEVMAALLALGEAPDEPRAAAALERLDLLDGGDGRDDHPAPPPRDPALTDEGW
jgi:hypothetical protein